MSNCLKWYSSGLLKMSLCLGRFGWSLSLHRFGKEKKSCRTERGQWRIVLWTAGKEWGNLLQNIWLLWGPSWSYRVVKSADRTGHVHLGAPKLKEPPAPSWGKGGCNHTLTRPMFLGFVSLSSVPCPSSLANNEITSLFPAVTAKSYADCPFAFFFFMLALQL